MKVVAVSAILAVVVLGASSLSTDPTESSSPGQDVVPLLTCPNVDASADNRVGVRDIIAVTGSYMKDWPAHDYLYMYDIVDPYNPQTDEGGMQRVDDVLAVVERYYETCPLVDTQVAQATRWIIVDHPELLTENPGALGQLDYVGEGGGELPGQGRHYKRDALWDAVFEPAAPEGLVYNDGRLVAQLYAVGGPQIGWVEDPGPQEGACWDQIDNGGDGLSDAADGDCGAAPPVGEPLDDIDIDSLCPPELTPCSWATGEGWHLHYYFCSIHVGTEFQQLVRVNPEALGAEPPFDDECQEFHDACPNCGGTWLYADRLGWMGHLWNWLPNANLLEDVGGTMNGRFADCYPDTQGWKAHNCPQ